MSRPDRPQRAVFLDRDGVLNAAIVRDGRPYPPANLEEFHILAPAVRGAQRLSEAGYLLIVVTNQPDIARGAANPEMVDRFNEVLRQSLPLTDVRVCPHDDKDACDCRKPKPGLLLQAAQDYAIDCAESFMVGDRWRDIEAGRAAGCRTVFIDYNYAERRPEACDAQAGDLDEAAQWILSHEPAAELR